MSVSVSYEIPFHDVDSLKIAWHGHYYKYFELARTALYRSHHLDVPQMEQLGYIFPVIESHCRYREPLHYGQHIQISAYFKAWEYYLLIHYKITDQHSSQRLASGYTKQAVCHQNGALLMPVPDEVIHIVQN